MELGDLDASLDGYFKLFFIIIYVSNLDASLLSLFSINFYNDKSG